MAADWYGFDCAKEDFFNAYRNWITRTMNDGSHEVLFDVLYDVEFEWDRKHVPRDADRAADGRYLRMKFADEVGRPIRSDWLEEPCSFLEFLVALSYSIEDCLMYDPEMHDRTKQWFWVMMDNLDLTQFDDNRMLHSGILACELVAESVNCMMYRRYSFNGDGGAFPLKHPKMDQRKVEIWYQANAYFMENYLV